MLSIRRSFLYDAIVVVQSLRPRETPTGRLLFEDVILPASSGSGIGSQFFDISSPRDLICILDDIARNAVQTNIRPVLHFEMHGGQDGLYPGGKLVKWAELRSALQRLNAATGVNLLVTLATCYGAYLVNTIDPESTAPFWGLIGPSEQVMEPEVQRGYQAFYRSLAAQPDLWVAFRELRNVVTFPDHWEMYLAEMILALGFGRYYESNSRPGALRRAEREIMKRSRRDAAGAGRPPAKRAEIRRIASNHELVFSQYKAKFLMLDRFQANADRFPLTMGEALEWYQMNEDARRRRGLIDQ